MSFGSWGEKVAEKYLSNKGLQIVERNFRCKAGEIDLIARDGNCLVFIEVKTRSNLDFGLPCEAITKMKLNHLRHTIAYYQKKNKLDGADLRIDVVEILYWEGQTFFHHIENVW